MHKHIFGWVVAMAAVFTAALFALSIAKAEASLPWINSPLSLQKQADTESLPQSVNGNIDCGVEDAFTCSVPTTYGTATFNNSVRLNGDASFKPVISYIDSHQHFLPVPNSGTAISYTTEPVYGLSLYFNYNFSSSITKVSGTTGFSGDQLQINRPPDGKLADKANHRLPADYTSMSFSLNGQWLVVSDPNVAMLRVNLQTFEVTPFAPGFDYSLGLDPSVKTAISNDGRYAVVASQNFNRFAVYDLSTCAAAPDNITGPVTCQSRDLGSFMRQQVAGYGFMSNVRFMGDDTLAVYATYSSGGSNKTARFIVSTSAITSQIDYLALGDSYISGEGAFDYQAGTDENDNHCHISLIGYPYLIGHDLNYDSYHSVACSGAVTYDITNGSKEYKGQAQHKKVARGDRPAEEIDSIFASFKPGYIDQLDFVTRYQPKIITVSIGGNDTGFADIVKTCVMSTDACYDSYEDRLELVRQINSQVFPKIVSAYQQLKTASPPDTRIYVIGYPQIAKPSGDCALNVHLDSQEILFSQQLIAYIDSVIQQAAARAGAYYVDTQGALNGHRLCEAGPGSVAMNGLTLGNDMPTRLGGPIGAESYHPNNFGYQLLENKILAATHNFTALMPVASPSAAPPPESSLEILNVPHSSRVVNIVEYDPAISDDVALEQNPLAVSVSGPNHALAPSTNLQAEIHSTPINLGNYTTNSVGDLSTQITLPAGIPAGYHSLHFYGTDIAGQPIDIYKIIYVGGSADDLDGDSIADTNQKCLGIQSSKQDFDQDGIDDACDGTISQPASSTGQPPGGTIGQQPLPPSNPGISDESTTPQTDSTPSAAPAQTTAQTQTTTIAKKSRTNASLANSESSPPAQGQNSPPAGQVLAESTILPPVNRFNPGWLLVLIPPSLSIFYLVKTRQ